MMEERSEQSDRPELSHLARWTVSSHKYGFGVDNLRDNSDGTFWQSEGPQPHIIDLSFPKRVFISAIALLTDFKRDDSYTPSKISIKCGTSVHDLQEVRLCTFEQPEGWQQVALRPMDSTGEVEGPPIPAHHIRVSILANHQNGKDTHVRGLKVFGSASPNNNSGGEEKNDALMSPSKGDDSDENQMGEGKKLLTLGHDGLSGFTSRAFKMHESIR